MKKVLVNAIDIAAAQIECVSIGRKPIYDLPRKAREALRKAIQHAGWHTKHSGHVCDQDERVVSHGYLQLVEEHTSIDLAPVMIGALRTALERVITRLGHEHVLIPIYQRDVDAEIARIESDAANVLVNE